MELNKLYNVLEHIDKKTTMKELTEYCPTYSYLVVIIQRLEKMNLVTRIKTSNKLNRGLYVISLTKEGFEVKKSIQKINAICEGEKKIKLSEAVPTKKLFEKYETERIKKEDLLGKPFGILAISTMTGEDGSYGVILLEMENKLYTTSISGFLTKRLTEAIDVVGVDEKQSSSDETFFGQPIEVELELVKNKDPKKSDYYNFKN